MTKLIVPIDENGRKALSYYRKKRRSDQLQTLRKTAEATIPLIIILLLHLTRASYMPVIGGYAIVLPMILVATATFMAIRAAGSIDDIESIRRINEHVKDNTAPDTWNGDRFADTAKFLEMLIEASRNGVSAIDRPRMQHLASCYVRDLRFISDSETPWRRIEAMRAIDIGKHLDDQSDKLACSTEYLRKSFAEGINWKHDSGRIYNGMLLSYPHVINMAQTFGIDMAGAVRPTPVALPGQVGGVAVEAPIPPQLLTLARQYRETDPRMLTAHDRVEGDAVVERDIPLLTEAWRKARITSDPAMHEAIDTEYAESAKAMCITLSDILVRVAQEARAALRDTGRYIANKHEGANPLLPQRHDAAA